MPISQREHMDLNTRRVEIIGRAGGGADNETQVKHTRLTQRRERHGGTVTQHRDKQNEEMCTANKKESTKGTQMTEKTKKKKKLFKRKHEMH